MNLGTPVHVQFFHCHLGILKLHPVPLRQHLGHGIAKSLIWQPLDRLGGQVCHFQLFHRADDLLFPPYKRSQNSLFEHVIRVPLRRVVQILNPVLPHVFQESGDHAAPDDVILSDRVSLNVRSVQSAQAKRHQLCDPLLHDVGIHVAGPGPRHRFRAMLTIVLGLPCPVISAGIVGSAGLLEVVVEARQSIDPLLVESGDVGRRVQVDYSSDLFVKIKRHFLIALNCRNRIAERVTPSRSASSAVEYARGSRPLSANWSRSQSLNRRIFRERFVPVAGFTIGLHYLNPNRFPPREPVF